MEIKKAIGRLEEIEDEVDKGKMMALAEIARVLEKAIVAADEGSKWVDSAYDVLNEAQAVLDEKETELSILEGCCSSVSWILFEELGEVCEECAEYRAGGCDEYCLYNIHNVFRDAPNAKEYYCDNYPTEEELRNGSSEDISEYDVEKMASFIDLCESTDISTKNDKGRARSVEKSVDDGYDNVDCGNIECTKCSLIGKCGVGKKVAEGKRALKDIGSDTDKDNEASEEVIEDFFGRLEYMVSEPRLNEDNDYPMLVDTKDMKALVGLMIQQQAEMKEMRNSLNKLEQNTLLDEYACTVTVTDENGDELTWEDCDYDDYDEEGDKDEYFISRECDECEEVCCIECTKKCCKRSAEDASNEAREKDTDFAIKEDARTPQCPEDCNDCTCECTECGDCPEDRGEDNPYSVFDETDEDDFIEPADYFGDSFYYNGARNEYGRVVDIIVRPTGCTYIVICWDESGDKSVYTLEELPYHLVPVEAPYVKVLLHNGGYAGVVREPTTGSLLTIGDVVTEGYSFKVVDINNIKELNFSNYKRLIHEPTIKDIREDNGYEVRAVHNNML